MPSPVSRSSRPELPARPNVETDRSSVTDANLWQHFYLLMTATMGLLFLWTFSAAADVNVSLRLIFLALLVLTLKRWTAAVLLGVIQVYLLFLEPATSGPIAAIGGFLWVMLTVLLVLVVSRYRTLQDRPHAAGLDAVRRLFSLGLQRTHAEADGELFNLLAVVKHLLFGVLTIAVAATIAAVLLNAVPLDPKPEIRLYTIREFSLVPSGYRLIRLLLLLFAVFLVAWLVVNELVWRTLSKRQASVYLRSTFLGWIHRDLRMVILKRMKIRRAKARNVPAVSRQDQYDKTVNVRDLEE